MVPFENTAFEVHLKGNSIEFRLLAFKLELNSFYGPWVFRKSEMCEFQFLSVTHDSVDAFWCVTNK